MEDIKDYEQMVEERKRRRRNQEPLAFCSFLIKRPGLSFGLALSAHILIASTNFILFASGYDILPLDFNVFPVELTRSHEMAQREEAWFARDSHPDAIRRFTSEDIGPTWERGLSIDELTLYFTRGGASGNVLTKEIFTQIKDIEDSVYSLPEYQDKFCQLAERQTCIKPYSLLRYFDGSLINVSSVFYDPNFENIHAVLLEAYTNSKTTADLIHFMGHGFVITSDESFSNVTRSTFPFGWPIPGNGTSREKRDQLEAFHDDPLRGILNNAQGQTTDRMNFVYISTSFFVMDVQPQAFMDMALAIGSLVFIFIFIWFVTRSVWLTGWAVFSIISSFMITNLIYRTVLNYQYFGYLNIISIFIILGIGADDIFVFVNTWKATAFEDYPSPAHRLSDCYRTASLAMFFTSFTTMAAFLIGGISPVLPLGSFGLFTGILILVNYVSIIVFYPTVVATHHVYFEERCCPCGCCYSCRTRGTCDVMSSSKSPERAHIKADVKEKPNVFVRFFRGPYFRFITNPITRWVVIVLFVGLMGFFIWSATRLEVDAEQIRIYRDDTNFGSAMRLEGNGFVPSGDNFVRVLLVWGMRPRDMSTCHRSDYTCEGEQVWDELFDLNTPPAQFALQEFCDLLRYGLTQEQLKTLMIRNNSLTGELEIDCFMDDLSQYMKREQAYLNDSVPLDLPLMQTNMNIYMDEFPLLYDTSRLPPEFYRYFEVGVANWLTTGYSFAINENFVIFNPMVGEVKDPPNTQPVVFLEALGQPDVAFYGTKLRYATIRANLSLSTQGLNYLTGLPVMEDWERFFVSQLEKMPPTLHNGFQTTEVTWQWLQIQQELVTNAQLGIIVGICIAFVVLVIATMNIITGLFATLLIACVTVSSLGVLPLAGWKVDVMVSMNLCLLVGLSVDYVVHMAEAYFHAPYPDRLGKVRFMLEHVGVSVLSGALTTIGASIFMLPAKLQFFLQFGSFLLCTIGFSLIYTLTFFTVILSMIGPVDNVGDIRVPFRALRLKILGRKQDDVNCENCEGKGFLSDDMNAAQNSYSKKSSEVHDKIDIARHSNRIANAAFDSGDNVLTTFITANDRAVPVAETGKEQREEKIISSNL